jgi:hypothetical protein
LSLTQKLGKKGRFAKVSTCIRVQRSRFVLQESYA